MTARVALIALALATAAHAGARIHVVWPDAPGLEAFVAGFGAPGAAFEGGEVLGAERVPTGARRDAWKDLPHRLVDVVTRGRVTDLVVGPDAKLAHLALQLAIKANVRVVLIACTDRSATALPIRGVTRVPGSATREPHDFEALGREARRRIVR